MLATAFSSAPNSDLAVSKVNNMSLVRNFTVQRADSLSPHHDPIQWSSNHQLAINNGTQITLLDPKLPSFGAKSIQIIDTVKLLDPRSLFQATNILLPEVIKSLPLRRLNNLTIESLDEPFNFRNINEPSIVSHKWSGINHTNRNNYLLVLFNTGELLILERDSFNIDKYQVKIQVLDYLIKDLDINLKVSGKEVFVETSENFLSLRIKTFDVNSDENGAILLSIITNNGDLLVYTIDLDVLTLKYRSSIERDVVKLKSSTPLGGVFHLTVITSDNSAVVYSFKDFTLTKSQTLSQKSRFLNSTINWISVGEYQFLLLTFTGKLKIYRFGATHELKEVKLSSYINVATVITKQTGDYIQVVVNYEDGKFESLSLDTHTLDIFATNIEKKLNSYVSKCLYSFQLTNSTEDDEELETGTKYLNQIIEGNFISYGSKLVEGVVTIIFRIIPKNLLNYETAANNELEIGFVVIDELKTEEPILNTPLAYLNNIWITKLDELPALGESLDEHLKFVTEVTAFKEKYFTITESIAPPVASTLQQTLFEGFHNNKQAKRIQTLFNFNKILIDSLQLYFDDNTIGQFLTTLKEENLQASKSIEVLLIKLFFSFIAKNKVSISEEIDKFVVLKYALKLDAPFVLPHESEILVGTKFFLELFKVTQDDIEIEGDLIESTSFHKWTKCKLTSLPLMQLNTRKDELNLYNYILSDLSLMPVDSLVYQLLENLRYCYISGNKAYLT